MPDGEDPIRCSLAGFAAIATGGASRGESNATEEGSNGEHGQKLHGDGLHFRLLMGQRATSMNNLVHSPGTYAICDAKRQIHFRPWDSSVPFL